MRFVFLGLSITSSWGNGHATNYRALTRALAAHGHDVLFLERDVPWYAHQRDLPSPPWCRTALYASIEALGAWREDVASADAVVIGSYVPQGTAVASWVLDVASAPVAFWDIDTPVTVAKLEAGDEEYLSRPLVPCFDLYLSFTAGPMLDRIEQEFGAQCARPFLCTANPDEYRPLEEEERWLLGYLGTYSPDRQATVESLLLEPARGVPHARFALAGPQYPERVAWPANVERIEHVAPSGHARFYARQRFTLNVTRTDMVRAGWSPSVRLFEAAMCGVPVITDRWDGIDSFFRAGSEIFIASSSADVLDVLRNVTPEHARQVGEAARRRALAEHTPDTRAQELVAHVRALKTQADAA